MSGDARPVAVVTGGGQGIGRGICVALAGAGYRVLVNYRANDDEANETVRLCDAAAGDAVATAHRADVTRRDAVEAMLNAARIDGPLALLVCNAGGKLRAVPFLDLDDDLWEATLALNLSAVFRCVQGAARRMIAAAGTTGETPPASPVGKIVVISSVSAVQAQWNRTHYCAAKAGVNGFVRNVALELAAYGIPVNAVGVTTVETPANTGAALADPAMRGVIVGTHPLGRLATPDDVAAAVCYLAGPGGDFVTGQFLLIDGGNALHNPRPRAW